MIARFWPPGAPECGVLGWAMLAGLAVVPVNGDSIDQVLRKIAVAGAPVMESYLNDIEPKIIALSSGSV
jgi:DNA-binding transcriptional regulator LsrR (DeoR family)